MEQYDVVIIGGGPAGLTAGIYTSRARLNTLILETYLSPSQITLTDMIENYPGFPEGIKGMKLLQLMRKQAQNFGTEFKMGTVTGIEKKGKEWNIYLDDKSVISTLSVIVATGAVAKELGVPGEKEYKGRGVSYCAVCDAPFFKDKEVAVIGGGDTAVEEALYLTKFASKVYLIHRRDQLRATKILQERVKSNTMVEIIWNSVVTEIKGKEKVNSIVLKNVKTEEKKELNVDGVFIFIGLIPQTDFIKGIVELDENGYIKVDKEMRTTVEGIFAAGDCIQKNLRQVVTACGDGATAGYSAQLYVEDLKGTGYKYR